MTTNSSQRIELLTLGDELLLGIRQNAHLEYIGSQLERHGLALQRNMVVQDDLEEIRVAFRNSWERSDIVVMTGGMGAHRTSNSREAVAEVLGLGLEFVPEVQQGIEEAFASTGRKMGKRYVRQCYKLEGSTTLANHLGTAPGLWLEREGKILIMLPGMASELRPMFETEVISRLQDKGILKPANAYYQLRTIGIDEESLEEKLLPVVEKHAGLGVDYCLYQGIIDVRLCSDAMQYSWEQLSEIGEECRKLLGEDCFAVGHESVAQGIFDQLRAMEKTLSIAESCTGGKLSDAFTNIPGSSKVFWGGAVCYNNEAKMQLLGIPEDLIEQHGAVSAEVAVAMATGATERFSTDYGLSVTGFAGPGDGLSENPVGTIYIGYCSPSGAWAHKVMYPGQREAVKVRAVHAAFDMMRRKLAQDKIEDFIADLDVES